MRVLTWLQVALKALSLKGIKDWKQLELFQREAVVLQVCWPPAANWLQPSSWGGALQAAC
jgi:hypothetical protein